MDICGKSGVLGEIPKACPASRRDFAFYLPVAQLVGRQKARHQGSASPRSTVLGFFPGSSFKGAAKWAADGSPRHPTAAASSAAARSRFLMDCHLLSLWLDTVHHNFSWVGRGCVFALTPWPFKGHTDFPSFPSVAASVRNHTVAYHQTVRYQERKSKTYFAI